MARTGRRSAAPDRHSADSNRTGSQSREANGDDDLRGQAKPGGAVSCGAVQGEIGDRDDRDDG
jgi:hypothetical protein